MADNYPGSAGDPTTSAVDGFQAIPSNSTVFDVSRAVYVGVSGDLAVRMKSGAILTFKAAPVGILPIRIDQVRSTGTTATDIEVLY